MLGLQQWLVMNFSRVFFLVDLIWSPPSGLGKLKILGEELIDYVDGTNYEKII